MRYQDPFIPDARDRRGFWHLPSVLMTAAAIGLIVLVNAGTPPPAGAVPVEAQPSAVPAASAIEPHTKPTPRTAAARRA